MCYPSYNALLLFPLRMFFVWVILGFACNLLPSLHETEFSGNGYTSSPVCSCELFYFI